MEQNTLKQPSYFRVHLSFSPTSNLACIANHTQWAYLG